MKPKLVYELADPRTDEVRYVGCTVRPFRRLYEHGQDVASTCLPWVRELRLQGLVPVFRVVDVVWPHDGRSWREVERRYIEEARRRGDELLNIQFIRSPRTYEQQLRQVAEALAWRRKVA